MPNEETPSASETLMGAYMGTDDGSTPEATDEVVEEVVEEIGEESAEDVVEEDVEESTDEEAEEVEEEVLEEENELGLTEEELQAVGEKTINKLTKRIGDKQRKLTDAEQGLSAAEERAENAEVELEALRAQLSSVSRSDLLNSVGVDPLLGAQDESEITQAEADWKKERRLAQRHMNTDLGEDEQGRIIAFQRKNNDGTTTDFTRDDVMARLDKAEEMLDQVIPQARKNFTERERVAVNAKQVYPELYKRNSPESKALAGAFQMVPGLSVLPHAPVLVGDMLNGQRLRDPSISEVQVGGRTFVLKGSSVKAPAKKKALPKVPNRPAPAGKPLTAKKGISTAVFDQKAVLESDNPREAAKGQYLEMFK